MSVKIDGTNYQYAGYSPIKEQQKTSKTEEVKSDVKTDEAAAVSEKQGKNEDTYVKSSDENSAPKTDVYRPSAERMAEVRANRIRNTDAFKVMAEALFSSQAKKSGALSDLQSIVKNAGAAETGEASSFEDDPTWGVEAVATRIVDFAKSLADGDDSKIDALLEAVKKGFGAAEEKLGGELPGISQKTYDRVMELFDEWKNPPAAEEAAIKE